MKSFIISALLLLPWTSILTAQTGADTVSPVVKSKIFENFRNLSIGFYIDGYLTLELDNYKDTSNIVPFSANCPMRNQFRLNVAAIELFYNAEKARAKLQLQYGDAPNLLSSPEKQFIKTIRQANFGFRLTKNLWMDAGYMFNPIGMESSWPVINLISSVTMCGYFEPGSLLGLKLSYKFSDKVDGGLLVGNPYSLAYQQTQHVAGILFINYSPLKNLRISYNNLFGNQALKNAEINNNLLYNQFIVTWKPHKDVNLFGQIDFAFQTNSGLGNDSTDVAPMASGFVGARYAFLRKFSLSGRYEFFHDPEGFLSGPYKYDGKITGLSSKGFAVSLEYKPVDIAYARCEYKFIQANQGNLVFYGNTSDHLQIIIFTTGLRF
jgi:hypothetical protein